jgi:hypothetical protein
MRVSIFDEVCWTGSIKSAEPDGGLLSIRYRSRIFVELEVALRARTDLRLLDRAEILEDAPARKRERQVRLEASIRLDGVLRRNAVKPDALFGLRFKDEEESYFLLEIDRGEMPR